VVRHLSGASLTWQSVPAFVDLLSHPGSCEDDPRQPPYHAFQRTPAGVTALLAQSAQDGFPSARSSRLQVTRKRGIWQSVYLEAGRWLG